MDVTTAPSVHASSVSILRQLRPLVPANVSTGGLSAELRQWRALLDEAMSRPPKSLSKAEISSILRDTSVLLVADHHASPVPCTAVRELIDMLSSPGEGRSSAIAVALECVPRVKQAELQRLLESPSSSGQVEIAALIRECWPWPCQSMAELILTARRRGCQIAAVGGACAPTPSQESTEDRNRSIDAYVGAKEPEAGIAWLATDGNIMAEVAAAQASRPVPGRIVVLIGASHLLNPPLGLSQRLAKRGIRSVICVPYAPEFELWLREVTGREPGASEWFEIAPGVYRMPTMTGRVIESLPRTLGDFWRKSK